jgi:serine/threonine protein phosphatase PrpC
MFPKLLTPPASGEYSKTQVFEKIQPRRTDLMRGVSSGLTDVGLKRTHNEDNFACDDDLGLYVVADGMGGHAAGEVASGTAVNAMREFILQYHNGEDVTWPFGVETSMGIDENALNTAVRLANNAVCILANENQAYNGMGTTIVSLLINDSKGIAAHVGDSRMYRLRNGVLEQLTMDHSWVNEQLRRNIISEEEAKSHRWRNVITRALGNKMDIDVELQPLDLQPDDVFLLCTDGLSGMVCDEDIQQVLLENIDNLPQATEALLNQANANGGIDNVTALLVRMRNGS